jgi:hypothetical protein
MIEVGRAQRTIFARYLCNCDLQREINEGLNVVESWNRANSVIFFGKGGDIATNRRDEQELFVVCLRVLRAILVYVNTLDGPGHPRRRRLGHPSHRRRPARPHTPVLDPRRPVRPLLVRPARPRRPLRNPDEAPHA